MRVLVALCLWGMAALAAAAMQVDRAIVSFPADKPPRQDVIISNPDDEPLFVDVGVMEVLNPGTEQEQRVVIKDPDNAALIATPRRLMVPPGGSRRVRLVSLNGFGEQEKVFRVDLRPVAAPEQLNTTGVRVLIGYQLLVFVAPQQSQVALEARRDGKQLELRNNGNVNVLVYEGEQCPPSPSTDACQEVPGKRLYPGTGLTLDLPMDAPVTFNVTADGQTSQRQFP